MNEQELTNEELEKAARRNIAFAILPALIRSKPSAKPEGIVDKAYQIADELIKQGE